MKLLVMSIVMSLFSSLYASVVVGIVSQAKGNVKVKNEGSIKKSKVQAGLKVVEGDLITTTKKATALISLRDGSQIILDQSSSIHFRSNKKAIQKEGKIYYKITSRDAKNSLKVQTPFAIIGVKGTTFIVNAGKEPSVSLQEGVIGVRSIKEEFDLYRKKVQEEFNNFVSQQEAEFQKYKNAQNKYAVAEPTKEFYLQEGNRITFFGKRVNEDAWSELDDAEFEHFEKLIEYMK